MQLGQQNLHVGPSERLPATPVHAVAGDELPLAQQPLDEQIDGPLNSNSPLAPTRTHRRDPPSASMA